MHLVIIIIITIFKPYDSHFGFFVGHLGFLLLPPVLNNDVLVHPFPQYTKFTQSIWTVAWNLRLGYSYAKILRIKDVSWHFGCHLGFQKKLKGEGFTPSWILFCTIRSKIIKWEQNYIRHFHLMAESCSLLPDYWHCRWLCFWWYIKSSRQRFMKIMWRTRTLYIPNERELDQRKRFQTLVCTVFHLPWYRLSAILLFIYIPTCG